MQSFHLAEIVIKGRGTRIYHPPHRVLYNAIWLVLRIFGSDFRPVETRNFASLRLYFGLD